MSFSLGPWFAEASQPANPRSGNWPEPGGMQSLQSMDDPVLGLHSCRALSPGPHVEDKPRGGLWEGAGNWKKGWSSVMQSVSKRVATVKPGDQRCRWKLRRF